MRIGRHIRTASQPVKALRLARAIGCEAVQIFVTNPRGWRPPDPRPALEETFQSAARELDLAPTVVHATYLINLASPRQDFFDQSVTLLRATLERAGRYGAASVVLHIGSHMGAGEDAGLERLADGLRRTLDGTLDGTPPGVMLLLENDVGAGGELGYRFEHIARLIAAVPEHEPRLGVCLDTAHLWGAGFDIGTAEGAAAALDDFDRIVGLRRIQVVHLNDTRVALGSHRDVHARIGEGIIGQAGLETVLRHPGLAHVAVLLETPFRDATPEQPDWAFEAAQLRRVYALAGREAPATPAFPEAPASPDAEPGEPASSVTTDALPSPKVPRARRKPASAREPAAAAEGKRGRTRGTSPSR